MSKTAIRMGHMANLDQGAIGIIKEYDTIRDYAPYVIAALMRSGDVVMDVTPSTATNTSDSLCKGVDAANNFGADCFVSCHVNAASQGAKGAEVIYYPGSESGRVLSIFIQRELEAIGFYPRGAREDVRGLYELKATKMPAVIVEPFFCTNASDVELYQKIGPKALGEAIAKGILAWKGISFVPEESSHFAQGAYDFIISKGVKITETRFDEPITRGEYIVLMARMMGYQG